MAKDTTTDARRVEAAEEEEDDDEEEYMDENEVYLRSKFYESWLWTDVNLPSRAAING